MSYRFGQPQLVVVTLTASEILNLFATPVALVPSPGTGFFIYPLRIVLINFPGSTDYGAAPAAVPYTSWVANDPSSITDAPDLGVNPFGQSDSYAWQFDNLKGPGDANLVANAADQAFWLNVPTSADGGELLTATVGVGGTAYLPGDTGTVNSNSGSATYQVSTVGGGGVVTAVTIPF